MKVERKVGVGETVLDRKREKSGVRAKVHFSLPRNQDFGKSKDCSCLPDIQVTTTSLAQGN